MSWSRLAAAAVVLSLTACGFRPMYGHTATDGAVVAELAAVAVPMLDDRIGQLVRNDLLDLLTPHGEPAAPRYVLEVTLKRLVVDSLIRRDGTASRARLTLRADYRLMAGETALTTGQARSIVSFDIPSEAYFAAIVSERDAERQAAGAVAEQIKTGLGIWFARGREAGPRP